MPTIVEELKSLKTEKFIIDVEAIIFRDDKAIPRENMMALIVGKEPITEDVRFFIHDLLWLNDEPTNELPYVRRLELLDKFLPKDIEHLIKMPSFLVNNRKEFDEALKKAYAYEYSEGGMLKAADSQYLPGIARTVDWCVYDDTKILTPNGYVRAHSLEVGDLVISKDGKPHAIKRIAKRRLDDHDKLYSIAGPTSNLHFFITGNHEILVNENQWESVEELEGNVVSVPSYNGKKKLVFVENRAGFFEIAKKIYYFYDFEIDGEDSYCTPACVLHNSKIKIVKEISCEIIGRMRKAMPFETIGRDQPNEDITGEEALKLYKRLQEKSNTWIFRCALKDGKEYVTIDTEDTVTKSDLEVKWNAHLTKPKWQGLDNPELWEMLDGFGHRKIGEESFGATYAKSFDIEPKLGMIVTVAPVQIIQTRGVNDKPILSWMFPKVRELKPESKEPDDVKDLKHLIEIRE